MAVRALSVRRFFGVATTAVLLATVATAADSAADSWAAAPKAAAPSTTPSPTTSDQVKTGKNGKAKAAPRVTFGIAPATPGHADNRTQFGYRLAPTASYDDHFVLNNFSTKQVRLNLTTVDLFNDPNGDVDAGLSRASAKDAGRWITLDHGATVVVPAATSKHAGQKIIAFTVKAPKAATPGDHAAGIIADLITKARTPGAANVQLNQRIGVRVLIRVPGAIKPGLAIRNLRTTYEQSWNPIEFGKAKISYTIVNTGNVIVGANQSATISGWFGANAVVPAAATPQVPLLLPGGSAEMSFTVDDVPPAFQDKFAVTLSPLVQASDATTVHLAKVSASSGFTAIPLIYIAIFVVLMLLLFGLWWWRRRRRRRVASVPPTDGPKTRELQPTG